MALKKKSKVSAEFSMSSLTDIIFLLLIFFMLTSSIVSPNALNLKLPGKWTNQKSSKNPDDVRITKNGTYYFNGDKISLNKLSRTLKKKSQGRKKISIIMDIDPKAPVEDVVPIMDLAMRYNINGIIASNTD